MELWGSGVLKEWSCGGFEFWRSGVVEGLSCLGVEWGGVELWMKGGVELCRG